MERSYSVTTGNLYTCQSNKPGPYEIELSDSSKKKKKKNQSPCLAGMQGKNSKDQNYFV